MKITWCTIAVVMSLGNLFYSCKTVYSPHALNVPLFQERGQFKATLATNNIQLAAAVSNHVGIMANGFANHYESGDRSFRNEGKGYEFGVGYFDHTEERLTYETYVGMGWYNVRIREVDNTKLFDANAVKYFVQPAIGWVNPFFEVAAAPRVSVINYAKPQIVGYTLAEQHNDYFDIVDQKPHVFVEPTVILRSGYRFVKVQVQFGRSVKLSTNEIHYDRRVGSVGVIFDIGRWYRE
jgi:hypothetical protein